MRWLRVSSWFVTLLLLSAASAVAQTAPWPSEPPPGQLPSRAVQFPPYEVRTLPNGLRVIAVLHHEQPVVTMHLLVRAGAVQDPDKKSGVAYLTTQLLDQGTTTRRAQEIADQIDSIGGALGTAAGADRLAANVIVMKDSFAFGMSLLADVIRNPSFAPEEIDRQKEQIIASLRVNADDPDYVASMVVDRLIYGVHPYGVPGTGTPETIASITRDDLRAFHRQYFVPNNMILAIVGDVTGEEAFAMAERTFGGWPTAVLPAAKVSGIPPPTRRVVVIDKPDAVQTEIRVGQLAIPRKHPEFLAWDLAVKILGGEGANRLQRVLRTERGLTYGASVDTQAMQQAGDYIAETDTRTETTVEALRLTIDEIARLPRQRVAVRELADAQAFLAGTFPLTIETPNEIAGQVLNVVFYDLPMAEIGTFPQRVLAVTPDDIQRAASQYVHPERLSIVLVGNARAFVPQLRAAGFTDLEVIPIGQLDLTTASLRKAVTRAEGPTAPFAGAGARPLMPPSGGRVAYAAPPGRPSTDVVQIASSGSRQTTASSASGASLLSRIVAAKGGLATLKAVRTVVANAETTQMFEQGPLLSTTTTYVVYPDKFRVDAVLAERSPDGWRPPSRDATVAQVYNAGTAWSKDPSGVRVAPAAMRDDFAASVRRDTIPLLIAASEGQLKTETLPNVSEAGETLQAMRISGPGVAPVTVFVNRDLWIVKQTYVVRDPTGLPLTVEERFSDYRQVRLPNLPGASIWVPFGADVRRDGKDIIKRTLKDVTLNGPVPEALFVRPN